jgi:uncharacterized protein
MELEIVPLNLDGQDSQTFLIYRPLAHLAFVGNRAMAELTRRVSEDPLRFAGQAQDESVAFLARSGFFVPDPELPQENPPPATAVLLLTNRCQLRCVYCYAAAGEYAPRQLKLATGRAAIHHVCEQARQTNQSGFQVDFHGGGEPTIEWRTLQELTEYARNRPLPSKISITSNAIWTRSQCEWLVQNMDVISVSMDGSISTQDRQRPLVNNHPSSPIVMRNLRTLDECNVDYGIRMTACPPWEQLVDDVRFILQNTACRNIQVEPAFNEQRGEHRQPEQDQEQSFVQAFIDAYDLALDHGASLYYSGARPHVLTRMFCSAPYHALIVNPDDEVVACYEIVSSRHPLAGIATFGRVADGKVEIDHARRKHLHNLLAERFASCCSCFCRWNCAGDCFTRAFGTGDQAHLAKSKRCDLNRELTLHILLSLIERQGGAWQEQVQLENEKYG